MDCKPSLKVYSNFCEVPVVIFGSSQFVYRRAQWEPCVVARAMDSTRGIALGGWWPLCIAAWLAAPPARGDCLESEPPAGSGLEEISSSISYVYFVGKYYGYFVGKYYGYFTENYYGKYYGYFAKITIDFLGRFTVHIRKV
jgi:hypothetical protein